MANKFETDPLCHAPGEVNINLDILETALSAGELSNFGTINLKLGKTGDGYLQRLFWSRKTLGEIPGTVEPVLNNREGILLLKPKGCGRIRSWLGTKIIWPSGLYLVNEKLSGIKYVGDDGLLKNSFGNSIMNINPLNRKVDSKEDTWVVKVLDPGLKGKYVYYVAFQNCHRRQRIFRDQWNPRCGFDWRTEEQLVPDGVVISLGNGQLIARRIDPQNTFVQTK